MKQKTDIPLSNWRGRYAAFIMSAVYGNKDLPNATFNYMRDYYRIDHNVTKADIIKIGCLNPDGTENTSTIWYAYVKASVLYDLVSKRRKERKIRSELDKVKGTDSWAKIGKNTFVKEVGNMPQGAPAKIDTSKVQFMGYSPTEIPEWSNFHRVHCEKVADEPRKTKRELLAEYYRIQSQMHAEMSRVCAELAEVA